MAEVRGWLDTHAFLWWLADSERLSAPARRVMADESNAILVSAASAWEIATKLRLGKLTVTEAVALDIAGAVASQGFEELDISVADAERAGRLPGPHRDPFDRMLIARPCRATWRSCRSTGPLTATASIGSGEMRFPASVSAPGSDGV